MKAYLIWWLYPITIVSSLILSFRSPPLFDFDITSFWYISLNLNYCPKSASVNICSPSHNFICCLRLRILKFTVFCDLYTILVFCQPFLLPWCWLVVFQRILPSWNRDCLQAQASQTKRNMSRKKISFGNFLSAIFCQKLSRININCHVFQRVLHSWSRGSLEAQASQTKRNMSRKKISFDNLLSAICCQKLSRININCHENFLSVYIVNTHNMDGIWN